MYKKVFNRLPDNYSREGQVNNEKFHQIIYGELAEIKQVFKDIKDYQDLDKAIGKTLENIGKNVLELRNTEDDELYRLFIKTKIMANLSKGDIETINEVATVLLGDGFRGVQETWDKPLYNNEPAGLVLKMRNQFKELPFNAIDRTIAGGVGLKWILELKQDPAELFIGMTTVSGEEISVYPYSVTEITSKGDVFVALGHNTSTEEINVYPKREEVI